MFEAIDTPLTRLRNSFNNELKKKRQSRSEELTQQEEEKIFAEVLSKSDYFNYFPKYAGDGFSVRKEKIHHNHGMFGSRTSIVWRVDLTIPKDKKGCHVIGTVSFKDFHDIPSVSFSNPAVQEMVVKKKSFAKVQDLLPKPVSKAVVAEVTAFLEKHKKAEAEIDRIYDMPANKNDVNKQAEKASVLWLFGKILKKPKSASVMAFDVDKLTGGHLFWDKYRPSILSLIGLLIGISILTAAAINLSLLPAGPLPSDLLGSLALCTLGIVFGSVITVCSLAASVILLEHSKRHNIRQEAAKEVGELLECAKDLSPAAVNLLTQSKASAPIVETNSQDASELTASYQAVFSSKKGNYEWHPRDAVTISSGLQ